MKQVRSLNIKTFNHYEESELALAKENHECLIHESQSVCRYSPEGRKVSEEKCYYDNNGGLIGSDSIRYAYDHEGRLLSETGEESKTVYKYYDDESGNSVRETFRTSEFDADEKTIHTIVKDEKGNIVEESMICEGKDEIHKMATYDSRNRMSSLVVDDSVGSSFFTWEYKEGTITEHCKAVFHDNNNPEAESVTIITDSGNYLESVCTDKSDGKIIRRSVERRIRGRNGDWYPVDVDIYSPDGLSEQTHYDYMDSEFQSFNSVTTRTGFGVVRETEVRASYYDVLE